MFLLALYFTTPPFDTQRSMILILSNAYDVSTSDVVDWLIFKGIPHIRINDEDIVEAEQETSRDGRFRYTIMHKGQKIDLETITGFWYRRGWLNFAVPQMKGTHEAIREQNNFLRKEYKELQSHIHSVLHKKNGLGAFIENDVNKLDVLGSASELGLEIPETLVTTNKTSVLAFASKHGRIITKGIHNGFGLWVEQYNLYYHTILLAASDIEAFPPTFTLSLFQECLEKRFELRIFFLDGICYSSVVFSQNDPKTKIDVRNYNFEKPNRISRYQLPSHVEEKIGKLMAHLKMRSGSIDIVVTVDNKYVFLDLNPIGQFQQVSEPCNYYLEEEIANSLSKYAANG